MRALDGVSLAAEQSRVFVLREPSLVFLALTGRWAEEGEVGDFHQPDGALATAGEAEGLR